MHALIEKCVCIGITSNPPRKAGDKVYETVHLFVDGEGGGDLRVNLPELANGLKTQVNTLRLKEVRARVNVREFKGSTFLDLVSVEPLVGTAPSPSPTSK